MIEFDKNTPPAPITPYFIYLSESLNLRFQEGSSARKNWNLPFDCAQGDLLWDFSRSNVPSPDGSGNPLARVAILGRAERATKRSSFAT